MLVLTPRGEGERGFEEVLRYIYLIFHFQEKKALLLSRIIYLLITQTKKTKTNPEWFNNSQIFIEIETTSLNEIKY